MLGRPRRARLLRLAAAVAMLTGSLVTSSPSRGLCFTTFVHVIVYFSDATYTTSVGSCQYTCDDIEGGDPVCTGTQTPYTRYFYQRCPCV